MHHRNFSRFFGATLLCGAGALAQTALHSPTQVQAGLGTLKRVVNHTQRLITAKNYTRLPHENQEFKEGADALDQAIADEAPDFKANVQSTLARALKDSQAVADAATAHDDAGLAGAHAALSDSVKKVLDLFPASVQPPATAQSP